MLYGFSLLFEALNIFLVINDFYWLLALPFALVMMLMFFFSLDKLILLLVFLTPFTFKFRHEQLGFTIDVPTEPIMLAIMLLFFFRLLYDLDYDKRVLKHPVTIFLTLNLIWMFVTSVTSEMPLVSFKFFISRLWFVVTFYFFGVLLFKEDYRNFQRYKWYFAASLAIMVIWITYQHYLDNFERMAALFNVAPFFNDHTAYGAVLSLVAPFFAVMFFNRDYSPLRRRASLLLFLLFSTGILLSFSRASWLSMMVAFGGFVILSLRIKFRWILAGVVLVVAGFFTFQHEIYMTLERNTQESSADFSEHLRSVTNITSDASNLERINRWRSAIRMYEERPIVGWGPGTYQFVYAPFQLSEDYTIISTHFGDVGNAHSEYLGPLAESGLPGMLTMVGLALSVLATGVRLYKKAPTREMRLMALGITLGFITYFTHGLLNNFLDTDKASVPFWGMMAMLVAMDVFYTPKPNKKPAGNLNTDR